MKQFVVAALICAVFTFSSAYTRCKKEKGQSCFLRERMECTN